MAVGIESALQNRCNPHESTILYRLRYAWSLSNRYWRYRFL